MKSLISALIAGLLFGFGLALAQMINPAKVIGFLDIFGSWDPSLMLVMGGALLVYLPGYFLLIKPKAGESVSAAGISKPLFAELFNLPSKTLIDRRLVIGALLFGIGWGMVGLCPGPALASLTFAGGKLLIFVLAMSAGLWVAKRL